MFLCSGFVVFPSDCTTFISAVLSVSPPHTSPQSTLYFNPVFRSLICSVPLILPSPVSHTSLFPPSIFPPAFDYIWLHLLWHVITLKNIKWRMCLLTLGAVSTRAAWSFIWSRVNLMDVNSIVALLWLSVGLHRLLGEISGSLAAWCSATFTS